MGVWGANRSQRRVFPIFFANLIFWGSVVITMLAAAWLRLSAQAAGVFCMAWGWTAPGTFMVAR
eukprot:6388840-Amphidinium_carterae.1